MAKDSPGFKLLPVLIENAKRGLPGVKIQTDVPHCKPPFGKGQRPGPSWLKSVAILSDLEACFIVSARLESTHNFDAHPVLYAKLRLM